MKRCLLLLALFPTAIACNSTEPQEPTPPRVRYTAVAAGHHRTCVLDEAGSLYCWGLRNDKAAEDLVPVRKATLEPLVSIIAEDQFFCGMGVSGGLHCWGEYKEDAGYQALSLNQGAGATLLHGVAMSGGHVCGLTADATAHCLGVLISGRAGRAWTDTSHQIKHDFSFKPIASTWRFTALAAGEFHTCGLRPTGEVVCWGDSLRAGNPAGPFLRQTNPCFSALTSRPCTVEPVAVQGLSGVTSLAAGYGHMCALANAKVFCWGDNGGHELGYQGENSSTPVELPLPIPVISLVAGGGTTCGLGNHGKVVCWGNRYGAPVGPRVVPGEYPAFSAISAGSPHSCGIADGAAYCWSTHSTSLGNGKFGSSPKPVRVAQPIDVREEPK